MAFVAGLGDISPNCTQLGQCIGRSTGWAALFLVGRFLLSLAFTFSWNALLERVLWAQVCGAALTLCNLCIGAVCTLPRLGSMTAVHWHVCIGLVAIVAASSRKYQGYLNRVHGQQVAHSFCLVLSDVVAPTFRGLADRDGSLRCRSVEQGSHSAVLSSEIHGIRCRFGRHFSKL